MTQSLHFEQPTIYYLLAGIAIAAFVSLAIVPVPGRNGWKFESVFLLSIGAVLFACRWPTFVWPGEFNVDESSLIACALKATVDWIPWHGFDASTSGPLNCYILLLPRLFAADIGYFSARVIGLGLIAGALCALYYTVKWIYGDSVARLSVLPPVLLFSLTRTTDFLHYSSEQFPIFLTTVPLAAAAFLARETTSKSARLIACATAGLFLGCPFLAKLQAAPIALAVLICLAAILIICSPSARIRKAEIFAIGAGLIVVPCVVLIILCATGGLTNAIISYFKMTLVFAQSGPPVAPSFFFIGARDYNYFAIASFAVILAGGAALYSRIKLTRCEIWALLSAISWLTASLFAIYRAHNPFTHYLLFSIIPVSFCVANVIGLLHRAGLGKNHAGWARGLFAAVFLIPIEFATLTSSLNISPRAIGPTGEDLLAISRHARPGDRMAVWGWRPDFYVQTKTIMATSDPGILPLMVWSRYREYFRKRFISDLQAHSPRVIVDAVRPGELLFTDRATQGIESFPQLESFVRAHYTQAEEVAGLRVFEQKNLR
ncbi:MAG: hypothetical protein ACJ8NS_05040 [Chthoniobacterales bacterium]